MRTGSNPTDFNGLEAIRENILPHTNLIFNCTVIYDISNKKKLLKDNKNNLKDLVKLQIQIEQREIKRLIE